MKYLSLMMMLLNCFVGQILGSENKVDFFDLDQPVKISLEVDFHQDKLYYIGKDNFDLWRDRTSVSIAENKPCFTHCNYSSEDLRANCDKLLQNISNNTDTENTGEKAFTIKKAAELKDFFTTDGNIVKGITEEINVLNENFQRIPFDLLEHKQKGDVVFSFTKNIDGFDTKFEINLATDSNDEKLQELMRVFCVNRPKYDVKERSNLERSEIIQHCYGGDFTHGEQSFYKQEKNRLEEEADKQKQKENKQKYDQDVIQKKEKQSALFYYRLKNVLFGGSIAAIIVYALYKNFYITS